MVLYKIKTLIGVLFFYTLIFSCEGRRLIKSLDGNALGTSYNIKHDALEKNNIIKSKINEIIYKVNNSMSTYIYDSDISKINRGEKVVVDSLFLRVYHKSKEVWKKSKGVFDPTIGALVNAYGFGPQKKYVNQVSDIKIDSLLDITGWEKIKVNNEGILIKSNKNIRIDFNAIAKGYTVDLISDYMTSINSKNYIIELGGEIVAKGLNPRTNKPWIVGIDNPEFNFHRTLFAKKSIFNGALATSGNYRKFRIDSVTGKKYTHTIDPRSGIPLESKILSVSVLANDCISADAWATSLMILSLNEGKEIIEKDSSLEALWIISTLNGIKPVYSSGWIN